MQGQVVYHPQFGRGTVTLSRKSGLEYQVRFDNRLVRWVRVDQLQPENAPGQPTPAPATRTRASNFTERKVIEALRLGIVPDDGLALFTYGREQEIAALQAWLTALDDPARLIIGDYGTGKTHLINYLRILALEAGYAVALVEMDPQAMPFSSPKRIYSQIVRRLQWKRGHELCGFRRLLSDAVARGLLRDHDYYKLLHWRRDTPMWEWLGGFDGRIRPLIDDERITYLPALYDYSTAANIYTYLLSGLGWASCQPALGLKGLVILFDESEALYAARGQKMERSLNFLNALLRVASSDSNLLRSARRSGLTYAGHAPEIPFLFAKPSGIKLLFAFTSTDELEEVEQLEALPALTLEPLNTDDWLEMLLRLMEVYQTAYRWKDKVNPVVLHDLFNGYHFSSTRAMVKGFVEALDISRFGTYVPDGNELDDDD